MNKISEYVIDDDRQGEFDPLGRLEVLRDTVHSITHNHVEGFDFAPIEMHDVLLELMKEERKNPCMVNKARCYDTIKSMIFEYWANKQEKVKRVIKEAIAA